MLHAADPNAVKVIDFGLAMELEVSLASHTRRRLIPLISLPAPFPYSSSPRHERPPPLTRVVDTRPCPGPPRLARTAT